MMSKRIFVKNIGFKRFLETWELQKKLAFDVQNNVKNNQDPHHTLLVVEHPPVYTVGIRSDAYSHEEEEKLKHLGAEFHRTNRGGLITFHGPGQLTIYPIIHLRTFGKGIKWYVSALERTVIRCLHNFDIQSHTTSDTGIWIGDRKICAIGIQGRHVTTHGLALNCNTNLEWFDHIVPCGIEGKSVTSVSREVGQDVPTHLVLPHFLQAFSEVLGAEIVHGS